MIRAYLAACATLIALKAIGLVTPPWWAVTSPLWTPPAVFLLWIAALIALHEGPPDRKPKWGNEE